MKVVEKIITEDDGERLQKCIVKLESKNCRLKAAAAEASEDYEVLQMANSSLLFERNDARWRSEDHENDLEKANANYATRIAALEATAKSVKTRSTDVATISNKHLMISRLSCRET
jgi:hypothetical protein